VQESVWRKLTEARLALHSELSHGAVLRTLVERATSLTDAQGAVGGLLDRSGADFEHFRRALRAASAPGGCG
jgi:hypothetical protein